MSISIRKHYYSQSFFVVAVLAALAGVAPLMVAKAETAVGAGSLVRCGRANTVSYIAADGQRHPFPDAATYFTWYKNYRGIKRLEQSACDRQFPVGSVATVRPGAALVRFSDSPRVYAVTHEAMLRAIPNPTAARQLYPSTNPRRPDRGWQSLVRVFQPNRKSDYQIGAPIVASGGQIDYNVQLERANAPTLESLFPVQSRPSITRNVPRPTTPPAPLDPSLPARGSSPGPSGGGGGGTDLPAPIPASPPASIPTPAPAPAPTTAPAPAPAPTLAPTLIPTAVGTPAAGTPLGVSDPARVIRASAFSLPEYNQRVTEPVFGTTIRRITDRVATGGFGTHIYSQLQAFSSDNQYMLLNENGDYTVRRVDTLARANDSLLRNINDPRWQPAVPHTIVVYDTNEDTTLRAQYVNVDTGIVQTVYTFPASYQRIRGNQSFDELSHDGRWIAGMAAMANGDQMIFSLDLSARSLGAQISLNGLYGGSCQRDPTYGAVEPDWVGVSPLGNYLMVQWKRDGTERCNGLESFNIQTGQYVGRVYDSHQHGDLGVDRDGVTEYFMTFEIFYPNSNGRPGQGLRVLPGPATGSAQPRYLQVMDWGTQSHISCQGPNGVCLVTSGSALASGDYPFEEEVWLQYTDGRVLRLAHHRSTECGYWVQPRASFSRDGRYVIFDSDWGTNRCAAANDNLGRGEAYLIELPAGVVAAGPAAIPPAPTPTANPTPTPSQSATPTATPTASVAPTPSAGSGSLALGSVGPLPASTYTLQAGETFTLAGAEAPATIYADPRMGTGTCFATDFIAYELYAADDSSNQYKLIGRHTGADPGQWLAGNSADGGGCAKQRILYTLNLGRGTHTVALCITNTQNTSQRICKTIQVSQ